MKLSNNENVNMEEKSAGNRRPSPANVAVNTLLHDAHPWRRAYSQHQGRNVATDASWSAFTQQRVIPITDEGTWACSNRLKCESQKQLLLGLQSGKWLLGDVMSCFRSNCFEKPKIIIARTIQGYVCKVNLIDENDPSNNAKLKLLETGWRMNPDQVMQKLSNLPSRACVKIAFKFLVDSHESVTGNMVGESLVNEMKILKDISSIPTCPDSICKYMTHWETHGEWGEYYLAVEYCSPNWKGVTKSMDLFEYMTTMLYRDKLYGCAQIQKFLYNHGLGSDMFWPFKTYKRLDSIQGIFAQIVDCLAWLHSNGFAHLDISLENIMIAGGTESHPLIKIIDFGVAKKYPRHEEGYCREKLFVGKREYFAPEVEHVTTSGNDYIPFAADMWTAGVCLWTMIFGCYPFAVVGKVIYDPKTDSSKQVLCNDNVVKEAPLDKHKLLHHSNYLYERMLERGLLPLVTKDAFDVLHKIFQCENSRITARDLRRHPFCVRTQK